MVIRSEEIYHKVGKSANFSAAAKRGMRCRLPGSLAFTFILWGSSGICSGCIPISRKSGIFY